MTEKVYWFNIDNEVADKWKEICPSDKYKVIKPDRIRDLLPKELQGEYLSKVDSVVVMCSGSTDKTYLVANLNRIDKGYKVDQDPFSLTFISGQALPSGCILFHGSWEGRTTEVPQEIWSNILASGIGHCFPIDTLPDKEEGDLKEIWNESHGEAFRHILEKYGVKIQ